ncbi:MAG: hypothetical protein R3Y50_09935 [Rikenellaceae bacterium]
MTNRDNFELRSEKVRNVIGGIPSVTIRIGTTVLAMVIFVIITLMYCIPYPRTVTFDISINLFDKDYIAVSNVDVEDVKFLERGQNARVLLLSVSGDYMLDGVVSKISQMRGEALIQIKFSQSKEYVNLLSTQPNGEATVVISNKPLLKNLIDSFLR